MVHVAELAAGRGSPATRATAVTVYLVLGVRPRTRQSMVGQVALTQAFFVTGHRVKVYEVTAPLPMGGFSVTDAMVGLVAWASAMTGPLQQSSPRFAVYTMYAQWHRRQCSHTVGREHYADVALTSWPWVVEAVEVAKMVGSKQGMEG